MPAAESFVPASSVRSSHCALQKRMSGTSPGSSSDGKAGSDSDKDPGTQVHEVERDDSRRIQDMQTAVVKITAELQALRAQNQEAQELLTKLEFDRQAQAHCPICEAT
eukprot:3549905-Amphidinium_carterae.1